MPAACALALMTASRSGARHELHGEGAAHHLLSGVQHLEAVFVLIVEIAVRQNREGLFHRHSPGALNQGVGTLGRPSGKRSNGFCAVSATMSSLLSFKVCAWVTSGAGWLQRRRVRTRL